MERKPTKFNENGDIAGDLDPAKSKMATDSRDLTQDDWRKMSLMDKWKASYNQDYADKAISQRSTLLGTVILWYVALSMEYTVTAFMIDDLFADYDTMTRYYLKVWCTFVFIQVIANWLCTYCYQSDLRETRDNPDMQKLLWDEHPAETGNGTTSGNMSTSGGNISTSDVTMSTSGYTQSNGSVIKMEDLNGDRTGLVWKWCDKCKMNQPPRAHHCKICQKCILKRDHHCFFTGTCIGYYNQRFFVMLVFYLMVASFGYMPFLYRYTTDHYAPMTKNWADYFLPITMYNWWFEGLEFKYLVLVSHWYTVWWGGCMACAFFCIQMLAISKGITPHELQKAKNIRSTASLGENFRDVFSSFWMINFLFPAVVVFRPMGDGKYWTNIKIINKNMKM